MCVCAYECTCACVCLRICVYVCVCVCVHIYAYVFIHMKGIRRKCLCRPPFSHMYILPKHRQMSAAGGMTIVQQLKIWTISCF